MRFKINPVVPAFLALSVTLWTELAAVAAAGQSRETRTCKLEAEKLVAETVDLQLSGACKAAVNAKKHLKIAASGACHVDYWGNPSVVDQDMSGVCSINKKS